MIKIDFWQVQQYLCLEKVRTIFKLLPKCVWLIKEAFLKLKNITLNFRKTSILVIFFHNILIDGCGKNEKWENEIILNEKNSEPDLLMITELKTIKGCRGRLLLSFSNCVATAYLNLVLGPYGGIARLWTFQKIDWFKLHSPDHLLGMET